MKRKALILSILLLSLPIVGWSDWTTAQLKYLGGTNGDWQSTTITNADGNVLLYPSYDSYGINYTMGQSTANGKWFHFVFPAYLMASTVGSTTTGVVANTRTIPIATDGYTKMTIYPYVTTATGRAGTLINPTRIKAEGSDLTVGLVPVSSMVPSAFIQDTSGIVMQFCSQGPTLESIAGVSIDAVSRGELAHTKFKYGLSTAVRYATPIQLSLQHTYSLGAAQAIIIRASGIASLATAKATTCFFLSLHK